MPFVLFDVSKGKYICWSHNTLQWKSSQSQAKKFKDLKHIQVFCARQLDAYCKKENIPIPELQNVKFGNTPLFCMNAQKEVSEEARDAEMYISISHMPENEDRQSDNEKSTSDTFVYSDSDLNLDKLRTILKDIPSAIAPLIALYGQIDSAIQRCSQIIRETDLETSDLLHKCEFANPNAAEGYKIFKEIQMCRLRRRNAKDMLQILGIIQKSGVVDSVQTFGEQYNAYCFNLENRTYHPRIREDLFPEKPIHSSKVI